MRRFCSAIAGVVFVLTAAVSGCGGDSGPAPGEGFLDGGGGTGVVPFKSTDTSQFSPMVNQMKEAMKKRDYTKKPVAPKESKADEKKK